jgi:hypothetical protein
MINIPDFDVEYERPNKIKIELQGVEKYSELKKLIKVMMRPLGYRMEAITDNSGNTVIWFKKHKFKKVTGGL